MSYHRDIIFVNPKWCFKPPPRTAQAHNAAGDTTRKFSYHGQKKECLLVPTSPAFSCMGQIKTESLSSSSYVMAALTSETALSSRRCRHTTGKVLSITRALFWRRRSSSRRSQLASSRVGVDELNGVGVADMDPPLPVVQQGARAVNPVRLWERRRCGGSLNGLQLQRLQSLEVMLK